MKSRGSIAAIFLCLFFAAGAAADTLEMKDGRVLQGRYLGGTQAMVRFEIDGEVKTFSVVDIVAVTFTRGSNNPRAANPNGAPPPPPANAPDASAPQPPPDSASAPPAASAPPDASQPPITSQDIPPGSYTPPAGGAPPPAGAQPPAQPAPVAPPASSVGEPPAQPPAAAGASSQVSIPAGTSILVRMIDGVDSSKNQVGDPFHASLETDLYVSGVFIARKGSDVYGRLSNAQEAGKFSGTSELQLELTRIVIDGRDYPLATGDYYLKGQSRGADTAKKVGGGAVLGAIIGAIAGGGKGAAIGAGAGSAAGATVQVLTKGEQVKVPSETLLEFRLRDAASVVPTQR
jgi:hypothetical protein